MNTCYRPLHQLCGHVRKSPAPTLITTATTIRAPSTTVAPRVAAAAVRRRRRAVASLPSPSGGRPTFASAVACSTWTKRSTSCAAKYPHSPTRSGCRASKRCGWPSRTSASCPRFWPPDSRTTARIWVRWTIRVARIFSRRSPIMRPHLCRRQRRPLCPWAWCRRRDTHTPPTITVSENFAHGWCLLCNKHVISMSFEYNWI